MSLLKKLSASVKLHNGKENWVNRIIDKFKLGLTTRERGRPKKGT